MAAPMMAWVMSLIFMAFSPRFSAVCVSVGEPQRSRRIAENSPSVSAFLCDLRGLFLLFDSQQLLCLRPEAFQFFILRLVLLHPRDCLVVPLVGFLLLVQFPVGHAQEKGVEAQLSVTEQ